MKRNNELIKNMWLPALLAAYLMVASVIPSFAEEEYEPENVGLTLVCVGEGEMDTTEDGHLLCTAGAGWEIVSITADSEVEGIGAGEQIPETEIDELSFEDGTTVTAVFERICDDFVYASVPDSAGAIF